MHIDGEEEEVESVWYGQRWRVPLEFIIKNAEIKGTNLLSASLFIVAFCGVTLSQSSPWCCFCMPLREKTAWVHF
jgi:hypothetical protein